MPGKRFSIERIIDRPREADVVPARGQTVGETCRRIGVSEQSSATNIGNAEKKRFAGGATL